MTVFSLSGLSSLAICTACCLMAFTDWTDRSAVFQEVASVKSGITWKHTNGRSMQHYMPEASGPGVAIFDYNNDGWMDILLIDSGTSSFYRPTAPLHPVLYRNNGDGTYTDVSRQAGITADLFGQGVAVGDYDGDGFDDIFITGVGRCVLYHNNGNGTFTDVTSASGIVAPQWGTSALWFDYDNDGKLDLFVAEFADYSDLKLCSAAESYGAYSSDDSTKEQAAISQEFYCNPFYLKPYPSHLYRNFGNGQFVDVSQSTGIRASPGKAWGVVATDVNNDGFLDLFVSNDTMSNYLWMNRGGKKFDEVALEAGVGMDMAGAARSGMGVDSADFDEDGRQDLIVANIDTQTTSLYHNIGKEVFDELNSKSGVRQVTWMLSGWGLRFLDYDNDGWPDLILAHGHPDDFVETRNSVIRYRQPIILMRNTGKMTFDDVSRWGGMAFRRTYSARGLAVGDLNNDGYPDVVFGENGGPIHLLMNTARSANNWLGIKLRARTTNSGAIGALIRWSVGGKVFSHLKSAGGSYLSSHDPREILGAGKDQISWVEINWPRPSRSVDRIVRPGMNQYITITEGMAPAVK